MRVPWYEARLPLKALVSTPETDVRAAEPVVPATFPSSDAARETLYSGPLVPIRESVEYHEASSVAPWDEEKAHAHSWHPRTTDYICDCGLRTEEPFSDDEIVDRVAAPFVPSRFCTPHCGKSHFPDWTHTPACEKAYEAYEAEEELS